jgi:hypothetical protein
VRRNETRSLSLTSALRVNSETGNVRYSREKVIDSKQPCGRHAEWDSEVVQRLKGLWLHSAGHRRQGRFHPYIGGRKGRLHVVGRRRQGHIRYRPEPRQGIGEKSAGDVRAVSAVASRGRATLGAASVFRKWNKRPNQLVIVGGAWQATRNVLRLPALNRIFRLMADQPVPRRR